MSDNITGEEVASFQDQVRMYLIGEASALGLPGHHIDGGGCDSGDWRDFTMSEIRQGVDMITEHYTDQLAAMRGELDQIQAAIPGATVCDFNITLPVVVKSMAEAFEHNRAALGVVRAERDAALADNARLRGLFQEIINADENFDEPDQVIDVMLDCAATALDKPSPPPATAERGAGEA